MKKGQLSNKLPKGIERGVADYSCFRNPESVKKLDETNDYSKFDFNEFFNENPEFMRFVISFLTVAINRIRSESERDNFNEISKLDPNSYLVDGIDLFQIGKKRIFSQLKSGEDFDINEQHKRLMEEMSEASGDIEYQNKPHIMKVLTTMVYLSNAISIKVENFPRHTNNGVKKEFREVLFGLKEMIAKLIVRGSKETSTYHINEKLILLRMLVEESRVCKYFAQNEDKNNKNAVYLLGLISKISELIDLMKISSKKI